MYLPELQEIPSKTEDINVFGGINDTFYIPEGSFRDMKNMSSDYYPAMGTRKSRTFYQASANINGMLMLNGVVYIAAGKKLYKSGVEISGVALKDSKKEMYAYGAYIVIMPDKVMYNTEDDTVKELTYSRECKGGVTLYLSDKNGTRIVVFPESATYAQPFSKSNAYEGDKIVNGLLDKEKFPLPKYSEDITQYYTDNNTQTIKNVIIATGSKTIVQSDSDKVTYPYYFADIDSANKIVLKKYDTSLSMWSTPDLYVTLWIKFQKTDDAEKMYNNIATGDYVTFETKNSAGNDIEKGDVKESYWNLIEHFNGYVKVENVLRKDNEIGLVFSNTGIDFLQVLQDTDGYLKYGNYSEGAGAESVKTIRSVYSLTTRIGFPWGSGKTICSNMIIKKDMPDMDYITVSNNRIWGCSNEKHEIYACKLGDPTSWYAYSGMANDSYAVTIGSNGNFTGACTYKGEPYFFKENLIIHMYGTKPSNYQLDEIYNAGIEAGSEKSTAYLNGYLYYKARNGIVRFDGSSVSLISEELGDKNFSDAIAGADDKKYYLSMKQDEDTVMYVYDSAKSLWHKEDDLYPDFYVTLKESVFAVSGISAVKVNSGKQTLYKRTITGSTGLITISTPEAPQFTYKSDDDGKLYPAGQTGIEWYAETGFFERYSIEHKYIQKLGVRCEISENATLEVSVKYDNDEHWNVVYSHSGERGEGTINKTFRPRRCEKFKLRFSGKGQVYVYAIRLTVNEGSDKRYGNV
jgi:hypothetical protein